MEKTGRQVAVIIDEYDAPLLDVLHSQFTLERPAFCTITAATVVLSLASRPSGILAARVGLRRTVKVSWRESISKALPSTAVPACFQSMLSPFL